jgi:sporulation protein YlmC with PRC-barrel domain
MPLTPGIERSLPPGTEEYDDYWDQKRGPGPRVMAADTLEGDTVLNDVGDKLGELSHIMIDVPTGRVAYGVLSVGGFLGVGDKLFAIPWKALRLDPEQHGFRLNVSKDKLETAEGFDKDAWPTMADQSWAERIHQYYGAEPYWR